eukprot:3453616-Rhodomonas_salina.2
MCGTEIGLAAVSSTVMLRNKPPTRVGGADGFSRLTKSQLSSALRYHLKVSPSRDMPESKPKTAPFECSVPQDRGCLELSSPVQRSEIAYGAAQTSGVRY